MNDLSFNQQNYLMNQIKIKKRIRFFRLLILFMLLIIWELCTRLKIIDVFFFSSPSKIFLLFIEKCKDCSIFIHTGITLYETIISFLLVFIVSLLFSTLLWFSDSMAKIFEPYLVMLNSLPKSALAPLLIVWLGTGPVTIIVAGISVAVFGSIINFYSAFNQCDKDKITLIYTLGGTKKDVFKKVILPNSVPTILSTTKVNIGLSLVGVIIGEFLAARKGLGYLIIYGSQVFQLNLVICSIVILCIMAIILYKIVNIIERLFQRYY